MVGFFKLSLCFLSVFMVVSCGGGSGGTTGNIIPSEGPATDPVTDLDVEMSPSSCAEILGGRTNIPTVLMNFDSSCDYYVDGVAVFTSDVDIPPGTVFLMSEDSAISFQSGSLVAQGTEEQPIVFRGEESRTGYWGGISLQNMRGADLRHVRITDGGQENNAGLLMTSGSLRLEGVEVSNSFGYGLSLDWRAVLEHFSNNRFHGNRLAGLAIDGLTSDSAAADMIAALDEASDYSGGDQPNGLPVVQVYGFSVVDRQLDLPIINAAWELNEFNVDSRQSDVVTQLVIPPGARLKLSGTRSTRNDYQIGYQGELKAMGTIDSPIVIERASGDDLPFPTFMVSGGGSLFLDHVLFSGGGDGNGFLSQASAGLVTLDVSGSLDARNTNFTDSVSWGVFCTSDSEGFRGNLFLDNVSFDNNARGDISPDCGL